MDSKVDKSKFLSEDNSLQNDNDNEHVIKKPKLCESVEKQSELTKNKKAEFKTINKNIEDEDEDEMFVNNEVSEEEEEGFTYPIEMDSSDMMNEVDFTWPFPTVTERYFTPYYQLDIQKPDDDICIRIHSNRICMISLAPSHIIFQENKTIESCSYKVSDKLDRIQNKVSGKSKHGAQPLQSNSNLCCLTCTDGSKYMIKCCMIGKLIEVNERLIQTPELLKKDPRFGGYIAIVLPNLKHLDSLREKLLTQEMYELAIKKRKEVNEEESEVICNLDGKEENKNKTEQVVQTNKNLEQCNEKIKHEEQMEIEHE